MIKPITVYWINVHITNNERKVYITESVSRDFSEYICIRNSFTKNMSKWMEIQKNKSIVCWQPSPFLFTCLPEYTTIVYFLSYLKYIIECLNKSHCYISDFHVLLYIYPYIGLVVFQTHFHDPVHLFVCRKQPPRTNHQTDM